jgi:N-acetylglucosaminyl-diphospho-decaprenol L-rhamnosyltransferase
MMPGLDIVVVNWNAGGQLRRCLESVAGTSRAGFELRRVVVVDNASRDGSADGLEEVNLPLTVIRNRDNRGFAAACNQGAAGSRAEYLLFLNPDTTLFADSLAGPIARMEAPEHRGTGIIGIRLVDERGAATHSCARFPTPARLVSKSLGLYRLSPSLFPSYQMIDWSHDRSREVDYVSGAFFLVRRSVFEELGGFDERFFVYFEETDFSKRMWARGWRSWFYADAVAMHRGGGLTEQAKADRLFYAAASRILYAGKQFRPIDAFAFALIALTLEPAVRIGSAVVSGSFGAALENARGYGRLYRAVWRLVRGESVYGERS